MKKHNIGYVLVPLFLCLGIIGGIFIGKYSSQHELSPEEIKFRSVLGLIRDQYVDEIDIDSLLDKSIPDLLASLDPHSAYIPAEDLTITNDDLEGSFGGIGVSFQILNDTVNVIEVIAGGPAEKVGLLPGDKILEANGRKISGANVSTEDVFKILRGAEGTVVKTVIKRRTSRKPLTFEIVRGEIPSNSVDAKYLIAGDIGYIKVSKFARTTYPEFFTALTELQKQGARKYIVDLRGNSGGFMDQAIYMVNEFLPEGRKIVYTKGRSVENETIAISDGTGQFQNVPLTVITNEFWASASEIFAGAIQDNDPRTGDRSSFFRQRPGTESDISTRQFGGAPHRGTLLHSFGPKHSEGVQAWQGRQVRDGYSGPLQSWRILHIRQHQAGQEQEVPHVQRTYRIWWRWDYARHICT